MLVIVLLKKQPTKLHLFFELQKSYYRLRLNNTKKTAFYRLFLILIQYSLEQNLMFIKKQLNV